MVKYPIVKVSKSGIRYFVVHGRKVIIESNMTKGEIASIYKVLLKSIPKKRRHATILNNSSAIIKQYINTEPRRKTRRYTRNKPFVSSIDPLNRVIVVSNPNDSRKDDVCQISNLAAF